MARAETIKCIGETGGGNDPLCRHNTCRRVLSSSPNSTTSPGTGTGTMHLNHNQHPLHPLEAVRLLQLQPREQLLTQQQFPVFPVAPTSPPRSPLSRGQEERPGGRAAESAPDLGRNQHSSRKGPLPDLLPQNEHLSRGLRQEEEEEEEEEEELGLRVSRVANQLRVIGDGFNTAALNRQHAAPHWQDLRDACRGLFTFLAQTLSTLYRLT